jgi:excisionase family DNA binding protein
VPQRAPLGDPDDERKWVQCANLVMTRIENGEYADGEWLPTQTELCLALSVNQTQLNQTLHALRDRQVITQVKNRGWYVGTGGIPEGPSPAEVKKVRRHREPAYRPTVAHVPPAFLEEVSFITCGEFAVKLRVSKMTAYRVAKSGEIEGVTKVGRSIRIPVSSAEAYLTTRVIPRPARRPGRHRPGRRMSSASHD